MNIDASVKQVAVVLQGEPMSKQQLCVECATAFFLAQDKARETHPGWVKKWDVGGYMKIVLKCPDPDTYAKIFNSAVTNHIPFSMAGRILVIGPAPSGVIDGMVDGIVGTLKLL